MLLPLVAIVGVGTVTAALAVAIIHDVLAVAGGNGCVTVTLILRLKRSKMFNDASQDAQPFPKPA